MAKRESRAGRQYIVRGMVQGVGFRWFTQRVASELGVRGWVRNCDDGSVEVYANGSLDQLAAFSGRLRQGPRFSDVRSVEEKEAPLLQSNGFSIQH